MIKFIYTKEIDFELKNKVFTLWNAEYPSNLKFDSIKDLDNYLISLKEIEHIIMMDDMNQVVGYASLFLREDEQWFAIIIAGKMQGKGLGKLLLDQMKKAKTSLSGWVVEHNNYFKLNGDIYVSPLKFYLKNDFIVQEEYRLENDKISAIKINWKK